MFCLEITHAFFMISPQSAVTSAHNKKKTQIIFMCTLYSVKPTVTFASSKMQIYWHGIQKQCVFCSDLNFCVFFEKSTNFNHTHFSLILTPCLSLQTGQKFSLVGEISFSSAEVFSRPLARGLKSTLPSSLVTQHHNSTHYLEELKCEKTKTHAYTH